MDTDFDTKNLLIEQIATKFAGLEDERGISANAKAVDVSLMKIQLREIRGF